MNYHYQNNPIKIPVPDNKLIEEHFGNSTAADEVSIAHMVAPPGWGEPHQTPEFDEYTLVSSGKKLVEIDGEEIIVEAGQSILIKKGGRVRYSNPFDEPCDYWSICIPAFSIARVHREEG